jgi:catechol 2,3-dioxygenase-like lactoylglutathione lyase family enzyme
MATKIRFSHLDYNVNDLELARSFYDPLMNWLGMTRETATADYVLYGNSSFKLCLVQVEEAYRDQAFHRKRHGLNHLAFSVENRADVDRFYQDFLLPRGIAVLYDGPGQFSDSEEYHAVFFEDPFRLKVEVVYAPTYLSERRS